MPPENAKGQQHDKPTDDVNAELTDEDIRKRTALVADMSAWKPKDFSGAVVMPDRARVYSYGFLEKPRGSHRLRKPAQRWLDDFFYEVVQTLRVWSPAGDVFDGECFEFKESFFRKYPYMVDGEILKPLIDGGGLAARILSAFESGARFAFYHLSRACAPATTPSIMMACCLLRARPHLFLSRPSLLYRIVAFFLALFPLVLIRSPHIRSGGPVS